MEELRKIQSSAFDTMASRKCIEDQNTSLELSGRVQELQNEVNCMNDSKDFQHAESIRSGNSHVTSRPVSFLPHPIPEGMLRHSFVTSCRREAFGTHMVEMPVWTVSHRFSHPQWRRLLKELWSRPTTTADFGSSFQQIPYTSYVCLLEGKIQDRGMYLLTISNGS